MSYLRNGHPGAWRAAGGLPLWPATLAGLTLAVGLGSFVPGEWPVRRFLVPAYLLVCPGMAYVRLLAALTLLEALTLSIGLSLGFGIAVALAMLYAGAWSPELGVGALMAITSLGVALQLWHLVRRRPGEFSSGPDDAGARPRLEASASENGSSRETLTT